MWSLYAYLVSLGVSLAPRAPIMPRPSPRFAAKPHTAIASIVCSVSEAANMYALCMLGLRPLSASHNVIDAV